MNLHRFEDALHSGQIDRVREELKRGGTMHYDTDFALRMSAMNGHTAMVRFLLDEGVKAWDSALIDASAHGYVEIVRLLIERGANVNAYNDRALRASVNGGHSETIQLLMKHGANIHAENGYALKWCIFNNLTPIVRCLLLRGSWHDSAATSPMVKRLFVEYGAWHPDFQSIVKLNEWHEQYRAYLKTLMPPSIPLEVVNIIIQFTPVVVVATATPPKNKKRKRQRQSKKQR